MFRKATNLFIAVILIVSLTFSTSHANARSILNLPQPGAMVQLSPAFDPVLIKGIKINPDNPLLFDFIVDPGKIGFKAGDTRLKDESERLIKYFLAALTIPEKDLWVNLSPYEKDRMIAPNLGQTVMGRDMLAQDYLLKQIAASLIYPESGLGKKFWDSIYAKVQAKFGSVNIPVNTFNKVWIVADRADVFERGQVAYVTNAYLKVMIEEDYLAVEKNVGRSGDIALAVSLPRRQAGPSRLLSKGALKVKAAQADNLTPNVNPSDIIRQIILPELEREVNTGSNFAVLRQMYYSMILASWYKKSLKNALLNQVYGNKSKVGVGVNQKDMKANEEIFNQYLEAYKKGVFNYIKDTDLSAPANREPRKYFAGGLNIDAAKVIRITNNIPNNFHGDAAMVQVSGNMIVPNGAQEERVRSSALEAGEPKVEFNVGNDHYSLELFILSKKGSTEEALSAVLVKNGKQYGDYEVQITDDKRKIDTIILSLDKRNIRQITLSLQSFLKHSAPDTAAIFRHIHDILVGFGDVLLVEPKAKVLPAQAPAAPSEVPVAGLSVLTPNKNNADTSSNELKIKAVAKILSQIKESPYGTHIDLFSTKSGLTSLEQEMMKYRDQLTAIFDFRKVQVSKGDLTLRRVKVAKFDQLNDLEISKRLYGLLTSYIRYWLIVELDKLKDEIEFDLTVGDEVLKARFIIPEGMNSEMEHGKNLYILPKQEVLDILEEFEVQLQKKDIVSNGHFGEYLHIAKNDINSKSAEVLLLVAYASGLKVNFDTEDNVRIAYPKGILLEEESVESITTKVQATIVGIRNTIKENRKAPAPIITAVPEAAVPEAAVPEAAVPEAAVPEAAVPEAAVPEAAVPEAAVPEAAVPVPKEAITKSESVTDVNLFDNEDYIPSLIAGSETRNTILIVGEVLMHSHNKEKFLNSNFRFMEVSNKEQALVKLQELGNKVAIIVAQYNNETADLYSSTQLNVESQKIPMIIQVGNGIGNDQEAVIREQFQRLLGQDSRKYALSLLFRNSIDKLKLSSHIAAVLSGWKYRVLSSFHSTESGANKEVLSPAVNRMPIDPVMGIEAETGNNPFRKIPPERNMVLVVGGDVLVTEGVEKYLMTTNGAVNLNVKRIRNQQEALSYIDSNRNKIAFVIADVSNGLAVWDYEKGSHQFFVMLAPEKWEGDFNKFKKDVESRSSTSPNSLGFVFNYNNDNVLNHALRVYLDNWNYLVTNYDVAVPNAEGPVEPNIVPESLAPVTRKSLAKEIDREVIVYLSKDVPEYLKEYAAQNGFRIETMVIDDENFEDALFDFSDIEGSVATVIGPYSELTGRFLDAVKDRPTFLEVNVEKGSHEHQLLLSERKGIKRKENQRLLRINDPNSREEKITHALLLPQYNVKSIGHKDAVPEMEISPASAGNRELILLLGKNVLSASMKEDFVKKGFRFIEVLDESSAKDKYEENKSNIAFMIIRGADKGFKFYQDIYYAESKSTKVPIYAIEAYGLNSEDKLRVRKQVEDFRMKDRPYAFTMIYKAELPILVKKINVSIPKWWQINQHSKSRDLEDGDPFSVVPSVIGLEELNLNRLDDIPDRLPEGPEYADSLEMIKSGRKIALHFTGQESSVALTVKPKGERRKLVVINQDQFLPAYIADQLTNNGFVFQFVSNYQDALNAVSDTGNQNNYAGIIAERVEGAEFLKAILLRDRYSKYPVFAISSSNLNEDRRKQLVVSLSRFNGIRTSVLLFFSDHPQRELVDQLNTHLSSYDYNLRPAPVELARDLMRQDVVLPEIQVSSEQIGGRQIILLAGKVNVSDQIREQLAKKGYQLIIVKSRFELGQYITQVNKIAAVIIRDGSGSFYLNNVSNVENFRSFSNLPVIFQHKAVSANNDLARQLMSGTIRSFEEITSNISVISDAENQEGKPRDIVLVEMLNKMLDVWPKLALPEVAVFDGVTPVDAELVDATPVVVNVVPSADPIVPVEADDRTALLGESVLGIRDPNRNKVLVVGDLRLLNEVRANLSEHNLEIIQVKEMRDFEDDFLSKWRNVAFVVTGSGLGMGIFNKIIKLSGVALVPVFIRAERAEVLRLAIQKPNVLQGQPGNAITFVMDVKKYIDEITGVLSKWNYLEPAASSDILSGITPDRLPGSSDRGVEVAVSGEEQVAIGNKYPDFTADRIVRKVILAIGHNILSSEQRVMLEGKGFEVKTFKVNDTLARLFYNKNEDRLAVIIAHPHMAFQLLRDRANQKKEIDFPFIVMPEGQVLEASSDGLRLKNNPLTRFALAKKKSSFNLLFHHEGINGIVNFRNEFNKFMSIFYGLVDAAMTNGGIDLKKLNLDQHLQGDGVAFNVDPAMIEQFKRVDFKGFDFKIESIRPLINLPQYLGLVPKKDELEMMAKLS